MDISGLVTVKQDVYHQKNLVHVVVSFDVGMVNAFLNHGNAIMLQNVKTTQMKSVLMLVGYFILT